MNVEARLAKAEAITLELQAARLDVELKALLKTMPDAALQAILEEKTGGPAGPFGRRMVRLLKRYRAGELDQFPVGCWDDLLPPEQRMVSPCRY